MKSVSIIKIRNIVVAMLLAFVAQIAVASFTGTIGKNARNKYSLKSFNKTFYKNASQYSLRAGYQYKGSHIINTQKDMAGITFNSMLRFEKGNTTYIYPYKHKVKVSVFKTPSATFN